MLYAIYTLILAFVTYVITLEFIQEKKWKNQLAMAMVLLIFIPLLVLVYFKANEANQQIASYQAELAVFRIAYLANSVGSLGTNTTVTTDIYIPQNIISFTTNSSGDPA